MSAAKLVLLASVVCVAASATRAQTPGPLDRLLGRSEPAAPVVQPPTPSGSTLPAVPSGPTATAPPSPVTLPSAMTAPQSAPPPSAATAPPPAAPPPAAATVPQTPPTAPPPSAMQIPSPMTPLPPAPPGGPNVQFQAPPPAATALERPATPPAAELDAISRLQADIVRLRLELEKARLEREIAQQRQPQPTTAPVASTPTTPTRPAVSLPPPPAATPRPDPAAADRRALPQVIEIRGAAGTLTAIVQGPGGQRLTLHAGDTLPNSPLKVQSIEPRQVNFVSQDGTRGPYAVPVSPPSAMPSTTGESQGPVVRPLTDAGLAIPIAR